MAKEQYMQYSKAEKRTWNEENTKNRLIEPALHDKGWEPTDYDKEYYYTEGRVVIDKNNKGGYGRQQGYRVDYLLNYKKNHPIALIEAKENNLSIDTGLQQAIDYAKDLDIRFCYSSNGDGFIEYDMLLGQQKRLALNEFPTKEQLFKRLNKDKHYTKEQQDIIYQPFIQYADRGDYTPRYYQTIAINRTVEAIVKGQKRVLLVMATGSGKTFTSFQIINSLIKSDKTDFKRVLYLADRNILIDQTMVKDFGPFKNIMYKVGTANTITKDGNKLKIEPMKQIHMALYQQLCTTDDSGDEDPFKEVTPDFFDLIIIDECHRGSRKEDSQWKKVLEYFSSAIQIGMTATPIRKEDGDNYDYFGEPIYQYTLKQGILDGYLAPWRVNCFQCNYTKDGYITKEGETDINGEPLDKEIYYVDDFGKKIIINTLGQWKANIITEQLKEIGPYTKTMIFCDSQKAAHAMAEYLKDFNTKYLQQDSRYITVITSDDKAGKKQLDNFVRTDQKYPVVAITSDLLTTGVDCPLCGLIVIDKNINSMPLFKQIVGRGTRLNTNKGKWHLEIIDFKGATDKFNDPDFDGDPLPPTPAKPRKSDKPDGKDNPAEPKGEDVKPTSTYIFHVEGEQITQTEQQTKILDEHGKTIVTDIKTTKQEILTIYKSLHEFITDWNSVERKQIVVNKLLANNITIDGLRQEVRKLNPQMSEVDIFDLIAYIAFEQKPLTRAQRAKKAKQSNAFSHYSDPCQKIINELLDRYATNGILELENKEIFRTFKDKNPKEVISILGGKDQSKIIIKQIEQQLYNIAE